jgi:hypothetical protein
MFSGVHAADVHVREDELCNIFAKDQVAQSASCPFTMNGLGQHQSPRSILRGRTHLDCPPLCLHRLLPHHARSNAAEKNTVGAALVLHEFLHAQLHDAVVAVERLGEESRLDGAARHHHATDCHRQRSRVQKASVRARHDRRGDSVPFHRTCFSCVAPNGQPQVFCWAAPEIVRYAARSLVCKQSVTRVRTLPANIAPTCSYGENGKEHLPSPM